MPSYYYVYSPISGKCTSCVNSDKYGCWSGTSCTQTHPIVGGAGWAKPMDIGFGAATEWVDLIVTDTINSFRTVRRAGVVCSDPLIGAPWDDALEIQLYTGLNATGTLVGKLLFGHASNMLLDGVRNTYFYATGKKWFEGICRTSPNTCGCGCYQGIHLHMQVDTGWNGYNSGLSASCSLQPTITKGSTFLYEWYK